MMPSVIITKRHDDFHAALEGDPRFWASSKTSVDAAVGNLMRTYPETFGVCIKWNGEDDWTRRYLNNDPLTRN